MIVIIGLGTGGIYAARWISRFNRKEEITIIERRSYETYSPCSIPLVVEGAIDVKEIIHPFPRTPRINLLLEHEVVEIDPEKKKVLYRKVGYGKVREIKYEKLIYGAGARPAVPPIPGVDKEGVFTVRTVEDALAIKEWIKGCKRALVIGAGAIGMEMAYALRKRGFEVTIVEMLEHPFPRALDEDMANIVKERLGSMGIECHCSSRVERITGGDKVEGAIVNGEPVEADMVILSVGVRPNTELLRGKVKMDDRGYVLVNERMQTSDPDIYAVGDCVRTPYGILQLATIAAREGIVAGINAAGGNAIYTKHTGAFVSAMGNFEVACVGGRSEIYGRGHSTVTPYSKHDVYVKIFSDKQGNIVGAQAVGYQASKKIDIVSALMRGGGKIWDLAFMEHAYCPASAHLYDVINIAANNAMRRIKIEKYEV
ncbi:NAD(P)H-nitrite reductase [Aciduliprofundum sp. MAR08-339]|uniref:NAD(P)/FAD-dependent oxidoreductase n=1 Tax=Aciduliprofundum sp. (strain MAR08-339) TaxID=673860 RepID=UPI0002A4911C|nr:NAD(P)H-nitrite reductase [Aciduliprofundum sp. MAR08-339]